MEADYKSFLLDYERLYKLAQKIVGELTWRTATDIHFGQDEISFSWYDFNRGIPDTDYFPASWLYDGKYSDEDIAMKVAGWRESQRIMQEKKIEEENQNRLKEQERHEREEYERLRAKFGNV